MNIFSQAKRIAGFAARKIPFPIQKQLFERVVQQIFKVPLQQGELDFLEQRKIKISLLDMGISWVAGLQSGRLVLYPVDSHADAHISGNVDEFVLLATGQEDPDTLFFQRRLNIEGSTEISLAVKNVMDSIGPLKLPAAAQKLLVKLVKISKDYSGDVTQSKPL